MNAKAYYNSKVKAKYCSELRGLSHKQLDKQRGLKGITLGPASPGRTLSKAEALVIEERLRFEGYLPPESPKPQVARLTRSQYREYMKSEAWRQVKRRYLATTPKEICYCCSSVEGPFDLHHRTYARLGFERLSDLCLVCRPCHYSLHEFADKHDLSFMEATEEWRKVVQKKLAEDLPWNQESPETAPAVITHARRARAMRDNYKAPKKKKHKGPRKFLCTVCSRKFHTQMGADQHKRDAHIYD